jgi:hypothetical protein
VELTCPQENTDKDRLYRGRDGEDIPDPLDIFLDQLTCARETRVEEK